jgi:proline utilization trans-activator
MTKRLELGGSPYNMPNFVDKMVYPLEWKTGSAVNEPPDVSGLPSLEDARYHFNTVKFHIGPIYRLLDESTFLSNLDEFYGNNPAAAEKASESRLWFVQFLLILTLGKALLSQSKSAGGPPGAKLFKRAMSLMPDHGYLWRDGLMAIDVLALAGLYLYCIDHRESAHVYVRGFFSEMLYEGNCHADMLPPGMSSHTNRSA